MASSLKEDQERAKAVRLADFYRYYADQQLARIVTSFLTGDADAAQRKKKSVAARWSKDTAALEQERVRFMQEVDRNNNMEVMARSIESSSSKLDDVAIE